ncbi:MAG: hypothetical protein ACRC2R_16850 [Xenococcaceae cyanobacterium]
MPNCGTTGAIPDCLGANDRAWTITYNIPISGYVRYRYGSGDWVNVIGGVRFENINTPAQPGQCFTRYFLHFAMAQYQGYNFTGWSTSTIRTNQVTGPLTNLRLFTSQFGEIFYDGEGQLQHRVRNAQYPNARAYTIRFGNNQQTPISGAVYGVKLVQIVRIDGQPDNCGQQCQFKIFDSDDKVIFEKTDETCPTAEVVLCYYDPTQQRSQLVNPRSYFGYALLNPRGLQVYPVQKLDGRKGVKVDIVLYPFTTVPGLGSQTIFEIYSPKGCTLAPKVCWECMPCKKCPPETCLKVLDRKNNQICCYGKNGKVIATVEPQCETPDC